MFVFVLDGALFKFNENTPAFPALFQFPPRIAAAKGPALFDPVPLRTSQSTPLAYRKAQSAYRNVFLKDLIFLMIFSAFSYNSNRFSSLI